ncbi:MAG: glycosyl transferase family 1, partial [Candidatus Moranbacteria bacterium CG_4_8_14_3_um_filter_34_16]
ILEAMSAGVPVVTSFNSSLPEVAGEAALYFNGYNAEELKEKLESVLKDSVLRKELVEKGKKQVEKFSWEKCAQETLNFLKEG